jgi:exoribonuclease R
MPSRRPHVTRSAAQSQLAESLAELRESLGFPSDFSAVALDEANRMAAHATANATELVDLRSIEFCTVDPEGSTDLDQALAIASEGDGFVVHYAIADVPSVVSPGGNLDAASRERGQTVYAADGRIPLYPTVLSEGAASLLPGQDRRAFVWRFRLDAAGSVLETRLERATVSSVRQWSYQDAQSAIDHGTAPESLRLLPLVGAARIEQERARGGASLNAPDEEIVLGEHGYRIERRIQLPIEQWNAQLSLMTGMAAAEIMLAGGMGLLRTMPAADADALAAFRAQTIALGLPWSERIAYGEYLHSLDTTSPAALAVMQAAASLFRGAGYRAFDGAVPADPIQAAVGAPYAHVTAPLRRLVDRFGLAICEAFANGRPAPDWARTSLEALPAIMTETGRNTSQLETGSIDRVEAAVLSGRIGDHFEAVVLSRRNSSARIQLVDPFVTATVSDAEAEPGSTIRVSLTSADIAKGVVTFAPVGAASSR